MKKFTYCFLVFIFSVQLLNAQTRTDDSLSLVAFYHAANGANWINRWDTLTPLDDWYGVSLAYGRVDTLDLINNNLSGNLIDLNLTNLKVLNLGVFSSINGNQNPDKNQLSGPITDFSGMPNLTSLILGTNQLSGPIPDFNGLPNLERLDLSGNQLTGVIPDFSSISNLIILYLRSNKLSGLIPDFSGLPNLFMLDLYNNELFGSIPDFSLLPQLSYLYLATNQLAGGVPDFSNLSNLNDIWISTNQLSGTIPNFNGLPKLKNFWAHNNRFSGSLPDFSSLPKLEEILLFNNKLSGPIPDFSSVPNLNALYLSTNQLSGSIPDFSDLPNLYRLRLHDNTFTFEDIVGSRQLLENRILTVNPTDGYYFYYPQDSISSEETINVPYYANYTLDLSVDDLLTTCTYNWYKDGVPYATTLINELNFTNFQFLDEGIYHCEVTNTNAPNLTLYSRAKTLYVQTCPSNETLEGGPPPFLTICPNEIYTYYVYDIISGTYNHERYIFYLNGQLVQDSTINSFTTNNNIENLDTLTARVYDFLGCGYDIPNYKVIKAYEKPKLTLCNIAKDSIQVQLTNGTPPWSFESSLYVEHELISTTSYNINNALDTMVLLPVNSFIVIDNPDLSNNPCSSNASYTSAYIDGCEVVCVGYANDYSESYIATFSNTPTSIQWSVEPADALTNGDITFLPGQGTIMLDVDFSNPTPTYTEITLQVDATTVCGNEVLTKTITLDQKCVWPGDVNDDGQVDINSDINWIDDAIGLGFAERHYGAYLGNLNNHELITYERQPICLAQNAWDWVPQSAKDWRYELLSGTITSATFNILDNNTNIVNTFNLKYADGNGNGIIEYDQNWDVIFDSLFTDVQNPTDHDIIVHQALENSVHIGNSAKMINNNLDPIFHIETNNQIYNSGDSVVFSIKIGDGMNIIQNVSQIAIVAEGKLGPYKQPVLDVSNSHLDSDQINIQSVDYPFPSENFNSEDSLRWHIAVAHKEGTGVDFAGQEVCKITCIVTPIQLYEEIGAKLSTNLIPITLKVAAGGIGHLGDSISYGRSEEITIWVRPDPILNARVFLGGAYDNGSGLMRDNLRDNLIPAQEPYHKRSGFNYPQEEMEGIWMTDSSAVLSVSEQDAIVDWVFVEIRDPLDSSLVGTRPALLTRQGSLVDVDGVSPVRLSRVPQGWYHVMIRHRNHLSVMTSTPVELTDNSSLLNFTDGSNATDQDSLGNSLYGLIPGDCGQDHNIDASDRSATWNKRNQSGYLDEDVDLSGSVDASDRSITWNKRNKFFEYPSD